MDRGRSDHGCRFKIHSDVGSGIVPRCDADAMVDDAVRMGLKIGGLKILPDGRRSRTPIFKPPIFKPKPKPKPKPSRCVRSAELSRLIDYGQSPSSCRFVGGNLFFVH